MVWDTEAVTMTADEALTAPKGGRSAGVEEAMDFLEETLAGGSKWSRVVEQEAQVRGISPNTLRRAREKLHVIARKKGPKGDQKWLWELPDAQCDLI